MFEPSSMTLISQTLICWAIEKCDEPTVSCVRPWNADHNLIFICCVSAGGLIERFEGEFSRCG